MFDKEHVIYLAGIIDGEGTFYIGQDNRHPKSFNTRLYVVNTNYELIQWLKDKFGGLVYSRDSKKNPHWRTKHEWILEKTKILPICHALLPYLICKREHANVMIEFRNTIDRKRCRGNPVPEDVHQLRLNLFKKLRYLNHSLPI